MHASRGLRFILLSGIVFGLAAAGMSWMNDAGLGWVFLAYIAGGNVGVSLAAALIYFQGTRDFED